jgi:hypothetical protein
MAELVVPDVVEPAGRRVVVVTRGRVVTTGGGAVAAGVVVRGLTWAAGSGRTRM